MAELLIMPKQGLLMTEGLITAWLKQEGEAVRAGEPLFEMETDKLTITIDAECGGTLLKILHEAGETVPITEPIAVVGAPGEDISELLAQAAPIQNCGADKDNPGQGCPGWTHQNTDEAAADRIFASPRARLRAQEAGVSLNDLAGSGPDGLIVERDVLQSRRVKASPLAKAVAAQGGMDLSAVTGTGSHGKIMKIDVAAAAERLALKPKGNEPAEELIPMRGMRKRIADKMVESLHTHAQLMHEVSVDMSAATRMREAFKKQDQAVTFHDIILLAVTKALCMYPILNSTVTEAGIVVRHYVNLGIAVDTGTGLVVPVIRNAERMSLTELSQCAADLIGRARNGALTPDDCSGGTFTVSNLGSLGLHAFTAILNTPESGILAVGAIEKTPVVIDDQIVIRPMMVLRLTYDHRVTDGAPAARFLMRVKANLEEPGLML